MRVGPVEAIITAETQRRTTPTIHYQISIPAGTPGFTGGYTQDRFRYPWNTAPRASQDVDDLQALVRVNPAEADLTSLTPLRKPTTSDAFDTAPLKPHTPTNTPAPALTAPLPPAHTRPPPTH